MAFKCLVLPLERFLEIYDLRNMLCFPNAKINLGLHVIRKNADGYHDIQTLFFPIPLFDVLEVIELPENKKAELDFTCTGIPTSTDENICEKAYKLLKKNHSKNNSFPSLKMHLHKFIPVGGGLGGGSSDATFALQAMNDVLDLKINREKLTAYARELGSDCPFFLRNYPVFAEGRGDIMSEVVLDLSDKFLVLIFPKVAVNTAWAYSQIKPKVSEYYLSEIMLHDTVKWQTEMVNDFEEPVFKKHPELKKIKQALYKAGAEYASMSGSGSAIYGIFTNEVDAIKLFPQYDSRGLWMKRIKKYKE